MSERLNTWLKQGSDFSFCLISLLPLSHVLLLLLFTYHFGLASPNRHTFCSLHMCFTFICSLHGIVRMYLVLLCILH
ncbi:hypothetical protein GYMLUDRAFT_752600 [Collybiopsis luxurians FD-317 M1]|uniref:Uncharacterized protein n=1 Tax=Collybiopsis luxurians FD-317 M1 TaxID=944289 RepID=A0A0D0CH70_9AGAR|nr:hypothetical protein GYMLUDRAFT_752600 [Collybiopsis luxurians FD-317 M1]